jgi:hypothetical protein
VALRVLRIIIGNSLTVVVVENRFLKGVKRKRAALAVPHLAVDNFRICFTAAIFIQL